MTTPNTCPDCGNQLPTDAPNGLCPQCLMKQGMEQTTGADPNTTNDLKAVEESPERYTYLGEHARGGMGRILLVHDEHLEREIALKELLPQFATGPDGKATPVHASTELVGRFLREAKITGRLEHPSILPVYELGQRPDGSIYYTMKLVRGNTLADTIKEAATLEERLKLLPHFVDLCQAIAYAHSRGVIHRDIKPSNVMVGEFGETVVIDWGLAKRKETSGDTTDPAQQTLLAIRETEAEDAVETALGQALGTPAYMPPEQARGDLENVNERSDIYSLGAVLYEILTGEAPFGGKTVQEVLKKAFGESPAPVRSIEKKAPTELTQLCDRAMHKEPDRRFQSARELAKKIENYNPRPFYLDPSRPTLRELIPELEALPKREQRRVLRKAGMRSFRKWRLTSASIATNILFCFFMSVTLVSPAIMNQLTHRIGDQKDYIASIEAAYNVLVGEHPDRPRLAPITDADSGPWVRQDRWFLRYGDAFQLLCVLMVLPFGYLYVRFGTDFNNDWTAPAIREVLAERQTSQSA